MIQRLRYKFIGISTIALIVVLITIIGSMVSISSIRAHHQADAILTTLIQHNGQLSNKDANQVAPKIITPRFSKEDMFQYRYFTVTLNKKNQVKQSDNSHIMSVRTDEIASMAKNAAKRVRNTGTIHYNGNNYAYRLIRHKNGTTTLAFLDLSMIMKETHELVISGICLGLISLLLFETVLILYSKRAIEPIIIAEKRQKEFITNAGHELKTPLAIISANTEMEEMLNGEDEWTANTQQQVSRMTNLISQLISLAKLEEQPTMQLHPIDLSAEVDKAINNFKAVIEKDQHYLKTQIASGLKITADSNYCYELISILLDNANKYCDPNGTVSISLTNDHHDKNVILAIGNDYAAGKDVDYSKFFERFYRDDQSHHHGKKAGFGIGLSMAQKLTRGFKGQLSTKWQDGQIIFTARFKAAK